MVRIGVYGASGFTGERVVAALSGRGVQVVSPSRASVPIEDAAALANFVGHVDVVVNCAGPFVHTADAVERAALVAGVSSLHLSCERSVMNATFARDAEAQRAGIALLASAGFSTMVAELAAWLAARPLGVVQTIDASVAHKDAAASPGTLRSYLSELDEPTFVYRDGSPVCAPASPPVRCDFGPLKTLPTLVAPLPEAAALARRVPNVTTRLAIDDKRPLVFMRDRELLCALLARAMPAPVPGSFVWRVAAEDVAGNKRVVTMHGEDTYGLSAKLCALAAVSLATTRIKGAATGFAALDPQEGLALLGQAGVRWTAMTP